MLYDLKTQIQQSRKKNRFIRRLVRIYLKTLRGYRIFDISGKTRFKRYMLPKKYLQVLFFLNNF